MALAPDSAPWYRRFRMLLVIYVIAMAFGVREYLVSRAQPEIDMLTDEWAQMSEVVERINPDEPDTDFLHSIQAFREGDEEAYLAWMEEAIASGVKHNDVLMQTYAQLLLNRGEDYRRINLALNAWRENHPNSAETIWLPLGVPPADEQEAAVFHGALAEVAWISRGELETIEEGGRTRVGVHLYFRPPNPVDIREAVAAVSVLNLRPQDRARLRVVCLTLTQCNVEPR